MSNGQRRFILREAELYEYEDVRRFYEDNYDEKVAERPGDVIRGALKDGAIVVAIDTAEGDHNRIFGASAAYSKTTQLSSGGTISLKEAGSTLIKETHRSFGLHKVFHWVRSLHEFILDRGGFQIYFSSVRVPNERSERSMLRAGFEQWSEAPKALFDEKTNALPQGASDRIELYRLPISALQEHAQNLLALEHERVVHRTKDEKDETIEITLAVQILERYRSVVKNIADVGAEMALV